LKETLEQILYSRLEAYRERRENDKAESAIHFLRLAEQLNIELDLWRLQNLFWELLNERRDHTQSSHVLICELNARLNFAKPAAKTELGTTSARVD